MLDDTRLPYKVWARYNTQIHSARPMSEVLWLTDKEVEELDNFFSDPYELRLAT